MNESATVTEQRYMKIRFNNGSERSFAFEPIADKVDASMLLTHVHKALDSRRLVLQSRDAVISIPFDNIESIEVAPALGKALPEAITVLHEFNS